MCGWLWFVSLALLLKGVVCRSFAELVLVGVALVQNGEDSLEVWTYGRPKVVWKAYGS